MRMRNLLFKDTIESQPTVGTSDIESRRMHAYKAATNLRMSAWNAYGGNVADLGQKFGNFVEQRATWVTETPEQQPEPQVNHRQEVTNNVVELHTRRAQEASQLHDVDSARELVEKIRSGQYIPEAPTQASAPVINAFDQSGYDGQAARIDEMRSNLGNLQEAA